MHLSLKQTQAIDLLEDNTHNVICYGGGAGGGKSMLGVYYIIKQCLKYPNTRWCIGRSRLKTLKETTLVSFFEVCKLQGLDAGKDYTYNQTTSSILFHQSGSVILLKDLFQMPSDPEFSSLGSLEISGCFIDEASEITQTAFAILQSRIRYKLDENDLIPKTLITCNPSKGWVFSQFWKPFENGTMDKNKAFIQSLVTDNPNISKHYINQLEELDPLNKKRLLFGDWNYSDDDSNLFSIDHLNDMFTNEFVPSGTKYMSVDVARFGRDKSVICIWSDWQLIKIKTWSKNTLSELADNVKKYADEFKISRSNIITDSDGVGGAIPDFIKGTKAFVNGSRALNDQNYKNLKTQCFYHLANKVSNGQIYIADKDPETRNQIIQELEVIKQHDVDKDNKISMTPKDQMKSILGRSPDIADAIAMRSFFDLNKSKIMYFG
jgi:hypothetical protein